MLCLVLLMHMRNLSEMIKLGINRMLYIILLTMYIYVSAFFLNDFIVTVLKPQTTREF